MKDVLSLIRSLRPSALGLFLLVATIAVRADAQQFDVAGHMQHSSLEGGCWILIAFDGKQYELRGTEDILEQVHKEGVELNLTVEPIKNAVSTCMVGEIVRVVKIRDVRKGPYDAPITPTTVNGVIKRTKSGTWYVQKKDEIKYKFHPPPLKKYQ